MRRVGLVVNPIAGMGGRVGLKGTDGAVDEARDRGADPRAPDRARRALDALARTDQPVTVLTYGEPMGEGVARDAGFDPVVVGHPEVPDATTAADTRRAVDALLDHDLELLLFVGGDGTAVDVVDALDGAGEGSTDDVGGEAVDDREGDAADDTGSYAGDDRGGDAVDETGGDAVDETGGDAVDDAPATGATPVPILGVPAGVKVYSGVFAVDPAAAGRIAGTFETTEPADVNDIDEERFREGELAAALRGIASVPAADLLQSPKQSSGGSTAGMAAAVAQECRDGRTYVFGPGSTVGAIERELGVDPSPLGVDVWRDGDLLVADGGESAILDALGEDNVVVVSPTGGQGFVLGRGNQQISPAVLRRADLSIVASRSKLDDLGVLRVDTGDTALDEDLRGWHRVRVGPVERRLIEVV